MEYTALLQEAAERKLLQPPFTVHRLQGNQDRRPDFPRVHLHVADAAGRNLKVTIGRSLSEARQRADRFHEAVRGHSAPTAFFFTTRSDDVWAQEWIPGTSLEEHSLSTPQSVADAILALEQLDRALETTAVESSWEAWEGEFDEFRRGISALPIWVGDEARDLEGLMPQLARHLRSSRTPRHRWSNGDFFSGNIRLTKNANPVLLDFEYGRQTHFFAEDHIRFCRLSSVALVQPAVFAGIWPEINAAWEVFFELRQLNLEAAVNSPVYLTREVPRRKAQLRFAAEKLGIELPGWSTAASQPGPINEEETVQLFWDATGAWSETHSQRLQIRRGLPQFVAFRLPPNERRLRLDPSSSANQVHLKSLHSLNRDGALVSVLADAVVAGADVSSASDKMVLSPHRNDPQLLIELSVPSAFLIAELLVSVAS